MSGNATHRFTNTAILNVSAVDASQVVTSADLDDRLSETYKRVGLRPGLLESLAGIRERRWWPAGVTFVDGAATAGAKAIGESGVDPTDIGLMVNTSVSRQYLEPSTAVSVHNALGLPTSCQNFDITNACLGFVNGIELAGSMIDSGLIQYALIVNGEDAKTVQDATIARLTRPETTARDVIAQFATLTEAMWADATQEFDWSHGMSRYIIHQVSQVHTDALCNRLEINPDLVPRTFPTRGNIGPASVPFTLAAEADRLEDGDRVLLMGIGSGLNASCLEIEW